MWEAPSPENAPQARCQRPTLPDGSSGLVLAGPGNRRGRSSPGPLLDGVGPPSGDAAGPRAGLPITARKSGNGRQPQRVAQLRSDTGTGYWKLVPGPPEPSGNNPLPPVPSPNSRQNPKPRRSLDSRSTGTVADLVPNGSRTQTLNQSSSPGFPDSRPASGVRAGTGVPWAPRTPGLGHAPLHHHHRHRHARVPCVRRFVRGRGVRPRQDVPHAGGPPALRVRARLRWAPGAPAGLRLRRRHLPRRVRAARRALPRPPGPARHVPRTLPQVVRARDVPAPAVVRGGPDRQRPLRGVSRGALSRALQPRPGALRQQQRHLHVLVSPPPGHLLPGPLHRRAPPGQLCRCGAERGAAVGPNLPPLSAPPLFFSSLPLFRHP
ncbi:follistatin-related protein 3 isoform X1 [Prionailurus viverrinus]|uniref:follistatin-related protein 3 isoform X1 n=1 Tax=Prionailurus viverrinus TaxID=61388 RepID=UPI001FF128A9|nr:follistatin-related protein 3 isoform X1 [Prionailurus viverrinus]